MKDDERYLSALLDPIGACRHYRPWFGTHERQGVELGDFLALFGNDVFYHAIGFDSPALYAAHRAAGGMTSLYRQLGVGSRRMVRLILSDAFGVSEEEATWRINRQDLGCIVRGSSSCDAGRRLRDWLADGGSGVAIDVRQGIKTGDARRQQSYVEANGSNARDRGLAPVLMLLSAQANERVIEGYRGSGWTVLIGDPDRNAYAGTYAFMRAVTGFDLEAFFRRHQPKIDREIGGTMRELLAA